MLKDKTQEFSGALTHTANKKHEMVTYLNPQEFCKHKGESTNVWAMPSSVCKSYSVS